MKKLIILVDDNPANLRIGKNVLGGKYTIATAPSAEKLLFLLRTTEPDLILLDVDMPDIDGYQTISILKTRPQTRHIPVIFLTSRSGEADKSIGFNLGAADYLNKPYEPEYLIDRIERQLK